MVRKTLHKALTSSFGGHSPDEKDVKKGLPGNLAQLVIFLVGLFITLVAYFSLSWLASNSIQQNQAQTAEYINTQVSRSIDFTILSLNSAYEVFSLRDANSGNVSSHISEWINRSVPDLEVLEKIYHIRKSADGWTASEIYSAASISDELDIGQEEEAALIAEKLIEKNNRKIEQIKMAVAPRQDQDIKSVNPFIQTRPFFILRPLGAENPTEAILAVADFYNTFNSEWFTTSPTISEFTIEVSGSSYPIFTVQSTDQAGQDTKSGYGHSFIYNLGNDSMKITLRSVPGAYMDFISLIPLLVLVCGVFITVLSTLYIRDHQRQAYRYQSINNILARKNYDLNMEIARREQLDYEIRKTEREYKAIIDAISDIIFEITPQGEILFLNETWRKITNFSTESAVGQNIFNFLHPDDSQEQKSNLGAIVSGKRHAYRVITRLKTDDGSYRSVEMAVSMLKKDEEHKLRIVGSFTDIEEYRRAEQALSDAEEKYREMVYNAAGGIYQVAVDGSYISANPAMANILGYDSTEDLMNQSQSNGLNIYKDVKKRDMFLKSLAGHESSLNFEGQVRTKSGEIIWVRENVRAVRDENNAVLYYEGSMEDITKRHEAEKRLREAKIQSDLSNRAKTEFLANISHELRTPLNSIIGFSEIIQNEVLGPLENRQYHEYAADIHSSGKKLLDIINEILDVSHIEAGERQLNESALSLKKIASSCVNFMSEKARENDLTIKNMIPDDLPSIVGEETAFKQMILNLLSNAIKFTLPGGYITLTSESDRRGNLCFSVTDTGVGLDESEIEKALSPFGQLESGLNKKVSGVGLGLTLVESLAKLHGGYLEIFSQKGVGTTATIVIPEKRISRGKNFSGDRAQSEAVDADTAEGTMSHTSESTYEADLHDSEVSSKKLH